MKWAIVEQNNIVSNVVVWDGSSSWTPPKNTTMIELQEMENCRIGSTYSAGQNPRFINPPLVYSWTSYEFLNRFTKQERTQIRTKAKNDDNVADFEMLATAAQEINSNDPITIAGMNYLVSVNILTPQRKAEILGE